jgi:hypothetical protein
MYYYYVTGEDEKAIEAYELWAKSCAPCDRHRDHARPLKTTLQVRHYWCPLHRSHPRRGNKVGNGRRNFRRQTVERFPALHFEAIA